MHVRFAKARRTVGRLAAVVVVLWWGGLNCLVGCAMSNASPDATSRHCLMTADGGDCCETRGIDDDVPGGLAFGAESSSIYPHACCSLEEYSAEVQRRLDRVTEGPVIIPNFGGVRPVLECAPPTSLPDHWARLPDRGGTRLLHGVFLV